MKDRTFSELATLCEALQKTKKRKDIAKMIGNFLTEISKDDIPRVVNLILGRIRDDKTASEIDSIRAVEKIYKEQLKKTGIAQ